MPMTPNHKIRLAGLGFILLTGAITLRLLYLQVYKHDFFKEKSIDQLQRIIKLHPKRGSIYDRNGTPLAITQTTYSAYAVPRKISNATALSRTLSPILNIPRHRLLEKLSNGKNFVWLKRKLPQDTVDKIKALDPVGIQFIPEEKRVYPNGALASDVVGFVGVDNQGLGGLEYKYNQLLQGAEAKMIIEGDPRGNALISNKHSKKVLYDETPNNNGGTIVTTLDHYIQFITEKYLQEGIEKTKAKQGQAIVMDPKTGEILAMADYPSFDPNNWKKTPYSQLKNSCITDIYEPGSTFKVFTVSAALNDDLVAPDTILKVPERLKLFDRTIKEAHRRPKGETNRQSVSDILQKSLNVGTTLLAQKLGEERLYHYIKQFQFGSRLGIDLPGESPGILRPLKSWAKVDHGMISFGQGIAVTPLQLISGVATIANKGIWVKPRIIKYTTDANQLTQYGQTHPIIKQSISEETAKKVATIMTGVVEHGTATIVKIKGVDIAGKTGTAQKAKENGRGYEWGKYIASFIGYFPVSEPKYIILVVVDTPKTSIWGSTVAGPIFKNIATQLVDYGNITPSLL